MISKIKAIRERDLSAALADSMFKLDHLARYGVPGRVCALAFDPVQSLFAVGTETGHMSVYGQRNVGVDLATSTGSPIKFLHIVKSLYLVAIDLQHQISVFSMESLKLVYEHTVSGRVSATLIDPSLDWLFLGLENGQVLVYDTDRGVTAPYRIGNLQKSVLPKMRLSPVLSLAFHPRDPSALLVAYNDCAVLYSISKNEIALNFCYEIPSGAQGGDLDPATIQQTRCPQLVEALWHPNGHHILTVHVDGSLVFWDATKGNLLHARTLTDSDVNRPRRSSAAMNFAPSTDSVRSVFRKLAWCCSTNPEDTTLLAVGGDVITGPARGVTLVGFGPTPQVSVTSYAAMGNFYANPSRQRVFPVPEDCEIINFVTIPRANPFYAGNCDPSHIIALLTTGELMTFSYPDGAIVTDPTILPPALGWISPYITSTTLSLIPRNQWVGMMAAVSSQDTLFKGGAPARRHLRSFQIRTALCTGHRDGTVKIWDASHGELEDSNVLEVSMSFTLNRSYNVAVTHTSFAGTVGELAVAVDKGEVILFTFGKNKGSQNASSFSRLRISDPPKLQQIEDRAPPLLKEGFLPHTLVTPRHGAVTALKLSNVGFVAIGYADGTLLVADRRGPAIIFEKLLRDIIQPFRGVKVPLSPVTVPVKVPLTPIGRDRSRSMNAGEYATCFEFGIYALGDDSYSSITLTVGSSDGNVYTLRLIPSGTSGYTVEPFGILQVSPGEAIQQVHAVNATNGTSAEAMPEVMAQLASGILIQGSVIAVSRTEVRVFRQPNSKISHRKLNFNCASSGLSFVREGDSLALVCVSEESQLQALGVPSLREIAVRDLPVMLEPR
jgi:syntaxin-binding protein 5